MQVVWFKRDLRIEDHTALTEAARLGPVLPLYIIEPQLWAAPDMSFRHYAFLCECLQSLNQQLSELGQPLIIRVGDTLEILSNLHQEYNIDGLWSHQETWNNWTYQRDRSVKAWVKQQHIPWHEPTQNGVIRCLKNRDGWSRRWYETMSAACVEPPKALPAIAIESESLPAPLALGLTDDGCTQRQTGGRFAGLETLQHFLEVRGIHYYREMSSPLTAYDACSRLSPYFAFGALSIREVYQRTMSVYQNLKTRPHPPAWPKSLRAFMGRLRWHCHFIQKLEDEPRIEYQNLHPAYDQIRTEPIRHDWLQAWETGHTGYPMIDACMRALRQTGWLNFRMRAMLMSFASYHLWLDWKAPALHLARCFVDYEPGIHYSQVQMQSGTTGINSIRIYNPIKQGLDHDPEAQFIKRWIPALASHPIEFCHTPWALGAPSSDYPPPLVDEKTARQAAASQIFACRKNENYRTASDKILQKHGSRKKQAHRAKKKMVTKQKKNDAQGSLPFDDETSE